MTWLCPPRPFCYLVSGGSCLGHFAAPTLNRPARNEEVGLPQWINQRTSGTSLTIPISQTRGFHQMFIRVGPRMQVHDIHGMLRSMWEVMVGSSVSSVVDCCRLLRITRNKDPRHFAYSASPFPLRACPPSFLRARASS
jgi:hypothetical protein